MIISLSEYHYTNKFIPISTDSTVLKVAKVSGLIFLGLVAFFLDCTLKLLAYKNITQQKDSDLSSLVEKLDSAETSDLPIIGQIPTETETDSLENLIVQEKILETDLFSLVESKLGNAEKTQDRLLAVEETFTKIDDQKYILNFTAQRKTLETCLKDLKIDPKDFLMPIYKHLTKVAERLSKEYSNSELPHDYKEYTCILRDAINIKECKKNKYALIIQELCFTKFVYTVLTDLEEKILKTTIGFDSSRNMTSSNISKLIKEDNNILRKQRKTVRQSILLNCEKARNAAGINSDQLCSANIPELRSIHRVKQNSTEYSIYYIRYPTPTIQSFGSAAIAPEFIGFLDYMQREEITFLHVNHQYMDKKSKDPRHVADNNRAKTIQRLEDTHAKVFHFLSLPFDGSIISEIDKESLKDWKENLVDALIKEERGFKLPKKFRKSAARKKKEIGQLLDHLHSLYFSGKSELSETERRVLLVIFYSYLKEYFKSEYQIRVMASVCKDNKDRGNVSACIDEALFNLRLGRENDPQALKDLHLRALSPYIFRNEGIVPYRLKFLTDLLDHISTLGDDQKEKICAFRVNEQYQIVNQCIPRSNEDVRI